MTAAATYNRVVFAGSTDEWSVVVVDEAGDPVDISDKTWTCRLYADGEYVTAYTVARTANRLNLTASINTTARDDVVQYRLVGTVAADDPDTVKPMLAGSIRFTALGSDVGNQADGVTVVYTEEVVSVTVTGYVAGADAAIADDTLGLLDPDTIEGAVDTIASMFATLGITLSPANLAGAAYIVGLHITDQPDTVNQALLNIDRLISLVFGNVLVHNEQIYAVTSQQRVIAPSLGEGYTGPYMEVGGTDFASMFTGPAVANFTGDGIDVRALVRSVSPDRALPAVYAEILTCVQGPLGHDGDALEAAVVWRDGTPEGFIEGMQQDEILESWNAFGTGITPNVWHTLRWTLNFTTGVAAIQKKCSDAGAAMETTADDVGWSDMYRGVVAADSLVDVATLPWYIGIGKCRSDVAWVQLRDGVDGDLVLDVWAEDETDPGVIPDRVASGDWVAAAGASVVTP